MTDVRSSDIVKAMGDVVMRPSMVRATSSTYSIRRPTVDAMVLSFDETERVRQVRQRSTGAVPTLSAVQARPAPTPQTSFTAVRPTAVEAPSRWHKVWQGMACCAQAPASPQLALTAPVPKPGGAWIVCQPPVSIGSLDGLRAGYQVRTTQGLDMIFGVALPTTNDGTEMVTMYRDLSAVADAQP